MFHSQQLTQVSHDPGNKGGALICGDFRRNHHPAAKGKQFLSNGCGNDSSKWNGLRIISVLLLGSTISFFSSPRLSATQYNKSFSTM